MTLYLLDTDIVSDLLRNPQGRVHAHIARVGEGALALSIPLTDDEIGELNPLGVNCLRNSPGAGVTVWGARTRNGEDFWQSSLQLPAKYISGTAGAGDAFCAGVLLGLHEGWPLPKSLLTGVCIASASLSDPTCTRGVKSLDASMALAKKFKLRRPIHVED